MTTIGDLTPNMIGRNTIRTKHEGCTVAGPLTDMQLHTETSDVSTLVENITKVTRVRMSIRLGSITLDGLDRDHHCEVIA